MNNSKRADGKPTVAMAMIAKDEARNIVPCFTSFWNHVDQVILVDTGSTDGTVEAARKFANEQGDPEKLTVARFTWVDDFSAARQFSWNLIDCDFGCWCDLDDTIEHADRLRDLAAQMPPNVNAFVLPYEYAYDEHDNVICLLWRERLVRQAGVSQTWNLPIHEILDIQGNLVRTDAVVWKHRARHAERVIPERNLRILQADYDKSVAAGEVPSLRTLAYLGTELIALGRPKEAIPHLEKYLELAPITEESCQVAHKLSISHRMLMDKPGEDRDYHIMSAKGFGAVAISHRPDWADGYLDLGECYLIEGKWEQALYHAKRAAECGVPETLLIINPLDYVYHPLLMQATALANLKQHKEALALLDKAVDFTPNREALIIQRFQLAHIVKVDETVMHYMTAFELLLRHDEALKARALLETVPYYAYHHPRIARARLDAREMTLHATDPELYSKYYRDDDKIFVPFEVHNRPVSDIEKMLPRAVALHNALREQLETSGKKSLRVLDLSAHDGWLEMYLHYKQLPAVVDCMDMNPEAASTLKNRKGQYDNIGEVVCGDLHTSDEWFDPHSYDAVVMFETIEHVPDTEVTLDAMETMCGPDGVCYISTPDGAYERGYIEGWHVVEAKGHLRAIPPTELAGWLCERGVVETFEVLPDRTLFGGWRPSPRKSRIHFFAGAVEARPEAIWNGGQGGSETALCKMAEEFAKRGYDVRVFCGSDDGGLRSDRVTTESKGVIRGQVLYQPEAAWNPGDECDLLVVSRLPEAFDRTIAAKHKVLWLHDAEYDGRITERRAEQVDCVVVMSQWQFDKFARDFPFIEDKLLLSRNGIEPSYFTDAPLPVSERKPWVVYSSSPDRGLDVLLEVWPQVRARVPDAELHHTYAPVYHKFKEQYPHLQKFHARIDALQAKCLGVVAHGNMGQRQLAALYKQARCWAYPSYTGWRKEMFPEISCISAMEAQAAGCVPVAAAYAALNETVQTGRLVAGDPTTPEWRERFVDSIVRALTDDEWLEQTAKSGHEHAMSLGWSGVCEQWSDMFLPVDNQLNLAA